MKLFYAICILVFSFFFIECTQQSSITQLDERVDSFANHYFNSRYIKAIPYCTPESEQWLLYASSQITQADIDLLKGLSEGASYETNVNSFHDTDTTASVEIVASNYFVIDTIGGAGRIEKEKSFVFELRKRGGVWLIHLDHNPWRY